MSDELDLNSYTEYSGSNFEVDDLIDEWIKGNTIRHSHGAVIKNAASQLYQVCGEAVKQTFKECLNAMENKWL